MGTLAGAGVGLVDAVPLLTGPRRVLDALTSIALCATLGLGAAAITQGIGLVLRRGKNRTPGLGLVVVGGALVPSLLFLVTALGGARWWLIAAAAGWTAVVVAQHVVLWRHLRLEGLGLLVCACNVPALLTLHFLGVVTRLQIYPTLSLAAAVGVWGLLLAQALALQLGYVEPKLAGFAPGAKLSAVLVVLGLACAVFGLRVVPTQYSAARWDAILLAWALLRAGGKPLARWLRPVYLSAAGAAALFFAVATWRAIRTGLPLVFAATGGELARDVLASVQSPTERLEALRATIAEHPAYVAAEKKYTQAPVPPRRAPALSKKVDTVLLITVEALPYARLGYSGHAPAGLTPFLDRLAAESLRYHRAYSPASSTLLSLPAILNSQYPGRLPWELAYLDDEARLKRMTAQERARWQGGISWPVVRQPIQDDLPKQLSTRGFHTHAILNGGDTHVFDSEAGLERTFDDWDLFGGTPSEPEVAGTQPVSDHRAVDALEHLLATTTGQRLFVWMHLFTPHVPYAKSAGPQGFTNQWADIHLTDAVVGRIERALQTAGRYDDSLIVFTADHGESFGDHGIGFETFGRHGLSLNEVQVHVPLLVKAPGVEPRDVDTLASGLDIAPTILAATDTPVPSHYVGEDLRVLAESAARPGTLFMEQWFPAPTGPGFQVRVVASIDATGRRKLVVNERDGNLLSYDLSVDPGENQNRFGEVDAADAAALAELLGWRHAVLSTNPYSMDHLFD